LKRAIKKKKKCPPEVQGAFFDINQLWNFSPNFENRKIKSTLNYNFIEFDFIKSSF